jgi:hypothetical protein
LGLFYFNFPRQLHVLLETEACLNIPAEKVPVKHASVSMKRTVLFLVITWVASAAHSTFAQNTASDTSFQTVAVANSLAAYEQSLNHNSILHNGGEYLEPARTNEAHPFFVSDDWVDGSVDYDGAHFDKVSLLYDITADKLITESIGSMPIVLIKEKVKGFTISDRKFIKLNPASFNHSIPLNGFYELMYNGKTQVIALHQKSNEETLVDRKIEKYFPEKNRYYILKNGIYNQVRGKASMLKLLADKKAELKKFARKGKYDFHRQLPGALSALAQQYDLLTERP